MLNNSLHFVLLIWSMVSRQKEEFLSFICRHDCSAVSNISDEALWLYHKNDNGAGSTPVMHWLLFVSIVHKYFLCFKTASGECLGWISGKAFLVYYDQVELIFEKIWASMTSMTIIYCKIRTFWPCCNITPHSWFSHIQDNRNSILIVVPLDSLVCVGWIRCYQTMHFWSKFGCFKVLQRVFLIWIIVVLNWQHCHILGICGGSVWLWQVFIGTSRAWYNVRCLSLIGCLRPSDRVKWWSNVSSFISSCSISDEWSRCLVLQVIFDAGQLICNICSLSKFLLNYFWIDLCLAFFCISWKLWSVLYVWTKLIKWRLAIRGSRAVCVDIWFSWILLNFFLVWFITFLLTYW